MTRTKTLSLLAAAAAVVLVALVVAACGGGDDAATAASTPNGRAATIGVSEVDGLGKILVDSKGRTVYLFENDTGPTSTCFGACASAWPPVTETGMPSAGTGVMESMLGTTKRPDGTMQVTYNGHPLYLYQGDSKPGDTTGQNVDGFGAEWYVLSPEGNKVEGMATSSSGGNGY
jgi:predicted lipoprotein with Yx(FWY)xxD motif